MEGRKDAVGNGIVWRGWRGEEGNLELQNQIIGKLEKIGILENQKIGKLENQNIRKFEYGVTLVVEGVEVAGGGNLVGNGYFF